ncbi:helix-turn-helix transcriptional regulator [Brevundimonas sp. A19_0]|nr:helix-turn-helix transcriptional regulator [Brevundimonas sp. A19_0]
MQLAGQRLRDKEIAAKLGISPKTVANTLASAYRKLGVSDRLQAARLLGELYPGQSLPSDAAAELPPLDRADSDGSVASGTWRAGYRPPPRGAILRLALILVFMILSAVLALGFSAILAGGMSSLQTTAPATAR